MSLIDLARRVAGKRKAPVQAGPWFNQCKPKEDSTMLMEESKSAEQRTAVHNGGQTPFRKRLAWWMKNPPADTITIDCGPAEAAVMLEQNDRNRGMSAHAAKSYAKMMAEGRWHYTRLPIIFSRDRLIDGQHRLQGVLISGCTVKMDLAFGADDAAFYGIDRGLKRTAGHIFSINGVSDANVTAAAINVIVAYEQGKLGQDIANVRRSMTPEELYAEYLKHPNIDRSLPIGRLFRTNRGLASVSLMTALHYVCAKLHRGLADEFFTKLATGESLNRKEPVYLLRKNLLEQGVSEKLTWKATAAMTLKAWNATRDGRPAKLLRLGGNEKFPRAH